MATYYSSILRSGFWTISLLLLLSTLSSQSVEAQDNPSASGPVPIEVGIRLHQIVEINQKKKNFTAVIALKARWKDPFLAYDPSENNGLMAMNKTAFKALTLKKGTLFPAAVIYNQQGRQQSQNHLISIAPDGEVNFLERATVVLQATNFDFRLFPIDTQSFEIHLDSLFPEDRFVFKELEGYSTMEGKLGEEEWVVTGFSTRITRSTDTTGLPSSRFTLAFTAKRHFVYYIMKIFIPLALIIIVSWFTFFLKDYSKRIDLAGANLLLFIAFNFTISNELPKLGYITFLDAVLASTFIITVIVVLINVQLKRLQNLERGALAESIDRYALWTYPLIYLVGVIFTVTTFFLEI
ncbi:MAG: electron transporter RnfC [Pseudomonadota bacterium]